MYEVSAYCRTYDEIDVLPGKVHCMLYKHYIKYSILYTGLHAYGTKFVVHATPRETTYN